jgi:hypothetical protein
LLEEDKCSGAAPGEKRLCTACRSFAPSEDIDASTWLNQRLNEKFGEGWTLDKLRESKISGKQKIIRILFKVTRLLFNKLKQENELLKKVG